MPKQVYEMNSFDKGIVSAVSDADANKNTLAYSLNLDPAALMGRVDGIEDDVETGDIAALTTQGLVNNTFFQLKDGETAFASSTGSTLATPRLYTDPLGTPATVSGSIMGGLVNSITEFNGMAYYGSAVNTDQPQMFTQYQHQHKTAGSVPAAEFGLAHLDRVAGVQGYSKIALGRNHSNDHKPSTLFAYSYGLGVKDGYADVEVINLETGAVVSLFSEEGIQLKAPQSVCTARGETDSFYILDDDDNLCTIIHVTISAGGTVTENDRWDIEQLIPDTTFAEAIVYPNYPITDIESGGIGASPNDSQRLYLFTYPVNGISWLPSTGYLKAQVIFYVTCDEDKNIAHGMSFEDSASTTTKARLLEFGKKALTPLLYDDGGASTTDYQQAAIFYMTTYLATLVHSWSGRRFGNTYESHHKCGAITLRNVHYDSPVPGSTYVADAVGGYFWDNVEHLYFGASQNIAGDSSHISSYGVHTGSFSTNPSTGAVEISIISNQEISVSGIIAPSLATYDSGDEEGTLVSSCPGFVGGVVSFDFITTAGVSPIILAASETVLVARNMHITTTLANKKSALSSFSSYRYKIAYEYDLTSASPLSGISEELNPSAYWFGSYSENEDNIDGTYEVQSIRFKFELDTAIIDDRVSALLLYRSEVPSHIPSASHTNYRKIARIDITDENEECTVSGDTITISYLDSGEAGPTFSELTGLEEEQKDCTPYWSFSCTGSAMHLIGNCSNVEELDDASTYLFISEIGKPLQFNTAKNFTKLKEVPICGEFWNGRFYVATENYLYKINPNGGLSIEDEIFGSGVEGPDAIYANDYGLVIAGRKQIYYDQGSGLIPIGEAIKKSDQGVGWLDRDTTVAPSASYIEAKQCFVFHHKNGSDYFMYAYNPFKKAWYLWETDSSGGLAVGPNTGLYGVMPGTKTLLKVATDTAKKSWEIITQKLAFPNHTAEAKVYDVRVGITAEEVTSPTVTLEVDGTAASLASVDPRDNKVRVYKTVTPERGSLFQTTVAWDKEVEGVGMTFRPLSGVRSTDL